jgi:Rhodopirellula transposase DDE domain
MPMGRPSSFKQFPYDYQVITPPLICFRSTQWNKIEHRLFCHITQTWRGRPLVDRMAVVELIAATTTKAGLKVESALDTATYEKGIKVSDAEMKTLDIQGDAFHPEWNYTIRPRLIANRSGYFGECPNLIPFADVDDLLTWFVRL